MDSFGQEIFDLKYKICELESKLMVQDKAKGELWDENLYCVVPIFGIFEVAHVTTDGKVYINLRFQGEKCNFHEVAGILGFSSDKNDFIISQAPEEKLPDLWKTNKNGEHVNLQIFRNKHPIQANCWTCKRKSSMASHLLQMYELKIGDQLLLSEQRHQMSPVRTKCGAPLYDGNYFPANVKFSRLEPHKGVGLEDFLNALLSQCQNELNFRSMTTQKFNLPSQFSSPTKPHQNSRTPTKPVEKSRKTKKVNSFRCAIKKSMANKTPAEQEQKTTCSSNDQCKEKVENEKCDKPSKHQGNAKTFKRKSKRPGRV